MKNRVIDSSLGIGTSRKVVARGSLRELQFQHFCRILYKILFKLNNKDIEVVAYANDVVLLIKGAFVSTIKELMKLPLGTLLK